MGLTDAQIKQFNDNGFVVLKGFFAEKVMDRLSVWLDELRDKRPKSTGEMKYYEKSPITGETILVRVENVLGNVNPDIDKLLLSPRATACLTQLFGEPPILFKEKVNYKLPGCRPDKLHQDQAAGWNAYSDFFITMGVAVDPNRKENAALYFMNSGHYEKRLMSAEWHPLSEADPPYAPADEYALLEADPGDVIFFDSYVPHGSPANTSGQRRRNIFLTFNSQSAGDMRARYYRDKRAAYPPTDVGGARAPDTYRV